jgi:type IV pilus assembly protein PilW
MVGFRRQRGVTLIEALIGLAVGAVVVAGAITIYASSVRGSNDTLLSTKLNQEVGALLAVMVNDIRRAGYWGDVVAFQADQNPFNRPGETALMVLDNMTSNTPQGAVGQGSCITYTYDATYLPANVAGTVEATDLFGFRLNGTVVEMRQVGAVDGVECIGGTCTSCTNGTWLAVTDPDLIEITQLTFDLANSLCLNSSEPNEEDDDLDGVIDNDEERDCYATVPPLGSDEITMETREVTITVAGRLASDNNVQTTATHTVRARNDLLRTW